MLSRVPEPGATVKALRAQAFDRRHASLTLDLSVENPGPDLAVTGAVYEILAQGRSFATGTTALSLSVPKGASAEARVPIELAYLDLPWAARNQLKAGGSVQIVVRGALRGQAGEASAQVEFDAEIEVGLTGDAALP